MFATKYYADPAPVIGVFWDRVAWAWRAQDGNGQQSTHPTWSEAQAALDAMPAQPQPYDFTVTWSPTGYGPDGTTVDLSTLLGYGESTTTRAPRKASKRKGKRK